MHIIFEGLIVGLFVVVSLWILTLAVLHGLISIVLTWQNIIKRKTFERPTWYYGNKFWDVFLNGNAFNISKTFRLLKLYYKGE